MWRSSRASREPLGTWSPKPWSWSRQRLHGSQSHGHGLRKDYMEHKAIVMVSAKITWSTKPWLQQRFTRITKPWSQQSLHGSQSHGHGLNKDYMEHKAMVTAKIYTDHKAMVMVSTRITWSTKPRSWSEQRLHGAQSHGHDLSKDYMEHKATVMIWAKITWSTKPRSWYGQRLHGAQSHGHDLSKNYMEHKATVMIWAKITWSTKPRSWSEQRLHGAQSHGHGLGKDYMEHKAMVTAKIYMDHKAMVMVSTRITWSTKPWSWSRQRWVECFAQSTPGCSQVLQHSIAARGTGGPHEKCGLCQPKASCILWNNLVSCSGGMLTISYLVTYRKCVTCIFKPVPLYEMRPF